MNAPFAFITAYLTALVSIILHESAHIAVAAGFSAGVGWVRFTPAGMSVTLENFDELMLVKKLSVLLAGPAVNFGFALMFFANPLIRNTNLLIGLFNLLPVYPLDGGRVVYVVLCRLSGGLRAVRFIMGLSRILCVVMITLGLIQLILFPFNPSLFFAGVYLHKSLRRHKTMLLVKFYGDFAKKSVLFGENLPCFD